MTFTPKEMDYYYDKLTLGWIYYCKSRFDEYFGNMSNAWKKKEDRSFLLGLGEGKEAIVYRLPFKEEYWNLVSEVPEKETIDDCLINDIGILAKGLCLI